MPVFVNYARPKAYMSGQWLQPGKETVVIECLSNQGSGVAGIT